MRKVIQCKQKDKKAGVVLLIWEKVDFETKFIPRNKDGYFKMIRGSVHQEDIAILNTCAPNYTDSKFMKPTLIEPEGEIIKSIIADDF